MATAIGYLISISINVIVLKKALNYKSKMVLRRFILIIALTIIMAAFVIVTHKVLVMMFGVAHSKLLALLYLVVCITIAVVAYGFLSLRIGLAQKLLGEKITKIGRKFGL